MGAPSAGLFELAGPGPLRDRLVAAVLAGEKVATSSLLAQYEEAGESLPMPGQQWLMVNSSGEKVAVVETVEVSTIRLGDADERLARDEGEGFRSVAEWREAHEGFWRADVLPQLRRPPVLDDDTAIVVERFRLLDESPGRA
jgi:uncharacterized protein YhfF